VRVAIMQPYWFPYIGYWQLIRAVDAFVIYDNIQYTKKGWINRNRFLMNGGDCRFSLPLKKASASLNICQREVAETFDLEALLRQLQNAYRKAPFIDVMLPKLREWMGNGETNLFGHILATVRGVCAYLGITTPLITSSTVSCEHGLRAEQRVKAICKALKANTYVNAIGGQQLYSKDDFAQQNIDLKFLSTRPGGYSQFGETFVPWLSIIDAMMFNSREQLDTLLDQYDLL